MRLIASFVEFLRDVFSRPDGVPDDMPRRTGEPCRIHYREEGWTPDPCPRCGFRTESTTGQWEECIRIVPSDPPAELTAWQMEKRLNELMPHVAYKGGFRVLDDNRGPFTEGNRITKERAVEILSRFH